jgi:hypothetical protein
VGRDHCAACGAGFVVGSGAGTPAVFKLVSVASMMDSGGFQGI